MRKLVTSSVQKMFVPVILMAFGKNVQEKNGVTSRNDINFHCF